MVSTTIEARTLGLFVGDADAYLCVEALKSLALSDLDIQIFTDEHVGQAALEAFLPRLDAAVVDIMHPQPADWLLAQRSRIKPNAKLYAVRSSSHTQDFLDAGFVIDKDVQRYFEFTSAENLKNLILFLAHKEFDLPVEYAPPAILPENGLYHPDAGRVFATWKEYLAWYQTRPQYRADHLWDVTIIFPTYMIDGKNAPIDALIRAYERQGINTVALLRGNMATWQVGLQELLAQKPLNMQLGSISGFTFKFSSALSPELAETLRQANVPIFNPLMLFSGSDEEWRASLEGLSPVELAYQLSTPELSGLIEPTVIGLKQKSVDAERNVTSYYYVPEQALVEKLARRAAKWHHLKRLPNAEKKVALVYYNHGAGKQNIGASYLNVADSIGQIVERLRSEGYTIEGEASEERIMERLLTSGRNIGSWAPDELTRLMQSDDVLTIDMEDYKRWLTELDPTFVASVKKDWGEPESSSIMVKDGKFIIPCVKMGNLTLFPQPVRGWSDDPEKLYHSTILAPHHQYVAFYLWLQKVWQPDAMISLGTHGTHEWLPGKQTGLSASCAPEALIGDMPSLYPYIVDDVGEGIQAKRRGRAVVIDHATPPFRAGGAYAEYAELAALISEHGAAPSDAIASAKFERIREMVVKLGLDKDLKLTDVTADALEKIEHYLLALKTDLIPYGLHTFGVSPDGDALRETAAAIAETSDQPAEFYQQQLALCGQEELNSLVNGLNAGYVPPASGNDPIRNPESLPTGKDFYSFDPDKVPSKEAWDVGKKAAQDMIDAYRREHGNQYPDQIGIILWSVEVMRNEGTNAATALYLMGMQPVWDARDKVKGVAPIPGTELGRPRIDVLLQMSGLFRDTFPTVALLLDKAVKQAATLTDVENFIKQHTDELQTALQQQGYSQEDAQKLATLRLFSAPPGAYGTKVDDMTGASGLWDDDRVVAEHGFIDMQSYGYSSEIWGESAKPVYRQNLKRVDATMHSISTNLYGTMDNDDMFQYLGGLTMAVRHESGSDPDVFVAQQRDSSQAFIEPLAATLGRELRSRYLNPKWIEGMKQENYAGAREIAEFVENMWGWQVTTPQAVDKAFWEQTYEVYVEDKYGQELKEFFNKQNPWAYQAVTARMLEAARKGYWQASDEMKQTLAVEYVMNVIEKGVACCDHTCNNPLLNQMVVNIVSLPGVLSVELVEQFKLAIEQATGKPLDQFAQERAALIEKYQDHAPAEQHNAAEHTAKEQSSQSADATGGTDSQVVQGYKMEEVNRADDASEVSSSGVQWFAAGFVLLILSFVIYGIRRQQRKKSE
ncbi:hypothetical protein U14_02808 [Candidatus Moduliflexus flocculans]|uniref:CobN/magnesium chelatase domain-containing protein n=1 Tax=Candidatus Moduliflexus flocculans TaxID=1499966 RepID=A0A081BME7_9BACT|nr:hypothetical protein U14_02808 [Candidatus Moduliflexus flocculans]